MRNTLINKFKIFAMLSAFVILFSSCDDSTSASEENSALKKDIIGDWKIYRTCVEYNNYDSVDYSDDLLTKVGTTDSIGFSIQKLDSISNIVHIYWYNVFNLIEYTAAWISSKTYSFPHWVIYQRRDVPYIESIRELEIEITEINPMKGTWTERVYDSSFTKVKIFRKIELIGKKYVNKPRTTNKKVG